MTPRRTAVAVVAVLCCLTTACSASRSMSIGPHMTADGASPTTTSTPETGPAVTTGDSPSNPPSNPPASLDWGPCDDPQAEDPALQCAALAVPLNYDDPTGEHIDIAMVRVPAAADDRVGAILFNPGGPGASGFDYIAQGGPTLVSALGLQQFDLIGFDPRGVDRSNGLRCLTDAQQDAVQYLDDTPDTPEEQAASDAADHQFETACVTKYGDTLRDYSTEATARDLDQIRVALGDDQISLLGASYGTYLFAMYATLFPDHVRAVVLDAAYEPTGDTVEQQYTTQLVGFEHAFDDWATWCAATADCAFSSVDVGAGWDALLAQLDAAPVAASDGRAANETVMRVATVASLYRETDWPLLAGALVAVRGGDAAPLVALADAYVGRAADGTFSTIQQSNQIITCASGIDAAVPDDPAALVATLQQVAPRFSRGVTVDDFTDSCADLVGDATPLALHYDGDAAIVVVGGTNDPATPFRWATEMQTAMGDASLVTYTGEGHGALLVSVCATGIEAATLVNLALPANDTTCEPDPVVKRPSWWDQLPVPDGVSPVIDAGDAAASLGLPPTLVYSELRTSSLPADAVLDAYDAALGAAGFEVGDHLQPAPGLNQGAYGQHDGDILSVLTIGSEALQDPALAALNALVPAGQTLVVLLARPA